MPNFSEFMDFFDDIFDSLPDDGSMGNDVSIFDDAFENYCDFYVGEYDRSEILGSIFES